MTVNLIGKAERKKARGEKHNITSASAMLLSGLLPLILALTIILVRAVVPLDSSQAGASDTLIEQICADRISGINTTVPDSNEDGLELELANCVTCPGDVELFGPIEIGANFTPPDLSGEYTQCSPGDYAWIGKGQAILSIQLDSTQNDTFGRPVQEYSGTIVFENLILVSEKIPDLLPWEWRVVATENYSGDVSGEVIWEQGRSGGSFTGVVMTDADCGFGAVYSVNIGLGIDETDGSVGISLDLSVIDALPLCPGDCIGNSGVDPRAARGRRKKSSPAPFMEQ